MRTNMVIDDELMNEAMTLSRLKTKTVRKTIKYYNRNLLHFGRIGFAP